MRADLLLKASSVHLAAGEVDTAIDSAAWAYSVAPDEATRAEAATAVALGLIDRDRPADAIVWSDHALTAVAGHRTALTCRGLGHLALGRPEAALADLDEAVALRDQGGDRPGPVPARARFARALALDDVGRRHDGYGELDRATGDDGIGRLALRVRGGWRLADGDPDGGVADLMQAARLGDRRSLARLLEIVGELPDDPEVRLTRLVALRIAGQAALAVELAEELLVRDDVTPAARAQVLVNRGYVARLDGGWRAAVEWLERAAELAPDDAEVATALGRALADDDRADDAIEVLLRAVAMQPGNGRPEICLGDLHEDAGRPDQAVEWYERALAVVPCDGDGRFGLARALTAVGRWEEAAGLAQLAAVAGHPGAAEWCRDHDVPLPEDRVDGALRLLGRAGNLFAAERTLREAAGIWLSHSVGAGDLAATRAADALRYAALCELDMGEAAAAEATLTRAIELRPALCEAWRLLGDVLVALGRPRDALAAYDHCAWCDPRYAGAPAGRAEALCRLGLGGEALAALDHAVELGFPDDPERQQELYLRRARLRQALGRWAAAAEDYTRLAGGGVFDADEVEEWRRSVITVGEFVAAGPGGYRPCEYRCYGLAREDWDGYGGVDLRWRLQFAQPPDGRARLHLAAAVGRGLRPVAAGGADLGVTVHWAGRFALLQVRADEGERLGALQAPLALAVEMMHRVSQLVEVVNLGAQGITVPEDPAEAWSVATQPVPDAGPEFGVPTGFWVPAVVDAVAFGEPTVDSEADAALWAELAGPEPAPEIKLVMIGPDDPPPPQPPANDPGELRRYPHDQGRFADNGAGVVLRRPEESHTGLDRVTAGGELHEVIPAAGAGASMARRIEAVSVSPDGAFAMFATGLGRDLYLLDIASGDTAALLEGVPRVESTEFIDRQLIVVKTVSWIAVFTLTPAGPVVVARDFAPIGPAVVCAGGRLIVVGGVREPELTVYGFAEGVFGRLAEISGPINCYRVWAVGDRAFAADRSVFELVGLLPAWERFAAWAAALPGADEGGGLVVEELDDAPYTGIDDGLEAIRPAAFWCVKGPAGLLMAIREAGEGQEVLVGDPNRVVATTPPLRESGFEYDWRPDGHALLVRGKDSTTVSEVDVAHATAFTVAYSASEVCYTATGFAVLRPGTLTLYAWQHGSDNEPVELVRYPVVGGATTLGWADGGRILHITVDGYTGLYVVSGGALHPVGSFPGQEWFAGWNHDGALYFANRHSGREFRAYRVTGFSSGVVDALGRDPVDRLCPAELPPVRRVERPVYPGTTQWRYFSDG